MVAASTCRAKRTPPTWGKARACRDMPFQSRHTSDGGDLSSSLSAQPVADPRLRHDQPWPTRIRFDLPPQADQLHAQRADRVLVARTHYFSQELLVGHYSAEIARE